MIDVRVVDEKGKIIPLSKLTKTGLIDAIYQAKQLTDDLEELANKKR